MENYHLIKDPNTATFYVQPNKLDTTLCKSVHQTRDFKQQNKRKQIDTYANLNDSRFEPIQKSPQNLSNVKKVTGLNFAGYKRRESLFPKTDQSLFYDANKEVTMKGLKPGGALPWKRMANRTTAASIDHETPEDSYDIMKAIEVKT